MTAPSQPSADATSRPLVRAIPLADRFLALHRQRGWRGCWDRGDYEQTLTVAVERADALVAAGRFPAPTVMKIDVEGAEPEVIDGLGSLLGSPALQAIVFEAEPGLEILNTPHALVSPLRDAGFSLRRLVRREPTHHALENYVASRGAAPC